MAEVGAVLRDIETLLTRVENAMQRNHDHRGQLREPGSPGPSESENVKTDTHDDPPVCVRIVMASLAHQ